MALILCGCTGSQAPTKTPSLEPSPTPSTAITVTPTAGPTATIPSLQAPSAYFSTSISGDIPLKVIFTDESLGDPTGWSWSFGDGSASAVQNPYHVYERPGDYAVSLTVTNAQGHDTSSKKITIKATPTPMADYVPLPPAHPPASAGILITGVQYHINYQDPNDSYFGPINQMASDTPYVPAGSTTFSYSLRLTNYGLANHAIDSVTVTTPGLTLVSVTPGLPTNGVTPASDIAITLKIQVPAGYYVGPLNIVVNPS